MWDGTKRAWYVDEMSRCEAHEERREKRRETEEKPEKDAGWAGIR